MQDSLLCSLYAYLFYAMMGCIVFLQVIKIKTTFIIFIRSIILTAILILSSPSKSSRTHQHQYKLLKLSVKRQYQREAIIIIISIITSILKIITTITITTTFTKTPTSSPASSRSSPTQLSTHLPGNPSCESLGGCLQTTLAFSQVNKDGGCSSSRDKIYLFLVRKTYFSVVGSCLSPCMLLLLPASGLWGSLGWDPTTQTCTILAPGEVQWTGGSCVTMMVLTMKMPLDENHPDLRHSSARKT